MFFASVAFLELGSWTVLKIFIKGNKEVLADSFIFKQMNDDGTFNPENA